MSRRLKPVAFPAQARRQLAPRLLFVCLLGACSAVPLPIPSSRGPSSFLSVEFGNSLMDAEKLHPLGSTETSPFGSEAYRLTDVVAGDLNNDGRKDLVFLETGRNYLDLVTFEAPHKLVPGNRWQVFEERTFRSRRNDETEPREALVADVTGDGKNDLVVLVHDRVLVYPQE